VYGAKRVRRLGEETGRAIAQGAGVRSAFRLLVLLSLGGALVACAHPARLSPFDYRRRPEGYHWVALPLPTARATRGRAPNDAYYGVDPSNGWTVYVGPDGIYYTFAHRGRITPADLHSYWRPHDATSAGPSRPAPK
jgi:hypothetical protein